MAPTDFFMSTPRELILILEGYNESQKTKFFLFETAATNAVGAFLSKKYKRVNPFEANKEGSKARKFDSAEQKQKEWESLQQVFK